MSLKYYGRKVYDKRNGQICRPQKCRVKFGKILFPHTLVNIVKKFSLIFKWFIQKIENLKFNIFSPCKMGRNTCKNFQKWIFSKKVQNFLENAQNLLIHPENWKSQNQFFPYKMGRNTWKIFKNRIFQKMLKIIWFGQKIRNFYVQIQVIGK